MLLHTVLTTSALMVAPLGQITPEISDDVQPIERPVADVAPPIDRPEPIKPLIGPREKLALGLFRQVVPAERQRDYDDAITILQSVANTVDEVRERRQSARPRPQVKPKRRSERRGPALPEIQEEGKDVEQPAAPNDAEVSQGVSRSLTTDPSTQSIMERNGSVIEKLLKARREIEARVARERQAMAGKTREQQEAAQRRTGDEESRDRREPDHRERERMERERTERERMEQENRERMEHGQFKPRGDRWPGHENPFRPGHGPVPPQDRDAEAHRHDHAAHDHSHFEPPHRRDVEKMNPHHELERSEREAHALKLDVAKMEAVVERAHLRAKTVIEPEVTALWAVERVVEVFGDDAVDILSDLKDETESDIVRRYINVRLIEIAGKNREAVIEPLKELIIADE